MADSSLLKQATYHTAPPYSFKGVKVWCKVLKAYDGDSCHIIFHHGVTNEMMTWKCRLVGIDTPERNSSQKQKALKARDFLVAQCTGHGGSFDSSSEPHSDKEIQEKLDKNRTLIWAELDNFDKYGRVLVTFKKGPRADTSFNDMLLTNGFAKELKY